MKKKKIAETFNTFFTNIVSNLKISLCHDSDFAKGIDSAAGDDPVTFILGKNKNHPSIIAAKNFCHENNSFNFETTKPDHVLKKIKALGISKTSQNGDVPTKITKETVELLPVLFIQRRLFSQETLLLV